MMTRKSRKAKEAASGFAIRVLGKQDVSEKAAATKISSRAQSQNKKKSGTKPSPQKQPTPKKVQFVEIKTKSVAAPVPLPFVESSSETPHVTHKSVSLKSTSPVPLVSSTTSIKSSTVVSSRSSSAALPDPVVVLTRNALLSRKTAKSLPQKSEDPDTDAQIKDKSNINLKEKSDMSAELGKLSNENDSSAGVPEKSKVIVRVKRRGKTVKATKSSEQNVSEPKALGSAVVREDASSSVVYVKAEELEKSDLKLSTSMLTEDVLSEDVSTRQGKTVNSAASVETAKDHYVPPCKNFTNSSQVKVVTPLSGEGVGDVYAVSVVPSAELSKSPQEESACMVSPSQMHTPRPVYKSLISSKKSKDKNTRESLSPVDISKIIAAAKRRSEISPTGTTRQPTTPEAVESNEDSLPALSVTYPSESIQQQQFFHTMGLVKKSELKLDDPTKSKLHREGGGRLRRVIKPKMAPSMVYKKIQLAKGCVIRGVMNDSDDEASEYSGMNQRELSPRVSNRSRILQLETTRQKKLSPEVHEHYQQVIGRVPVIEIDKVSQGFSPVQRKLSYSSLTSKKTVGKPLASFSHGSFEPLEEAVRKCQAELRQAMKQKLLQKKRALQLLTKPSATSVNNQLDDRTAHSKAAFDKSTEETKPKRRSTRQREAKRREWCHLLRANPDEYEVDSELTDEQDKIKQRKESHIERGQGKLGEDSDVSKKDEPQKKKAKKENGEELITAEKINKALGKVERMTQCRDPKAFTDLYEEIIQLTGNVAPIKKVKDWAAAKKMLEDAKSWQESKALLKRKAAGAADELTSKKKKKKSKRKEGSSTSISIVGPDGKVLSKDMSAPLLDKIKPVLSNILNNDSAAPGTVVLRESDLTKHGKCISQNPRVYVDILPSPADSVSTSLLRETDCVAPHMCPVCFINDHDYCDKIKKVLQGQRMYCIHRILCKHYKGYPGLPREKLKYLQEFNEMEEMAAIKENLRGKANGQLKRAPPVSAEDLLCDEEMLPDEPSWSNTEPDMLKRHLQIREDQITRCLGVQKLPNFEQITSPRSTQLPEIYTDDECDEGDWDVEDYGAEVVIPKESKLAPPDLTHGLGESETEEDAKSEPSILKSKQRRSEKKSGKVDSKARTVRGGDDNGTDDQLSEGTVNLHDLGQQGSHKLIKVKVQRLHRDKVVLKHTFSAKSANGHSEQEEEMVIREVDLPESMQDEDDLNSEFINDIIAKEAIKLVGENAVVKSKLITGDKDSKVKLVRETESSSLAHRDVNKAQLIKQYDKLEPPSVEEREKEMERTLESVTTAEKITKDGGDTCEVRVPTSPPLLDESDLLSPAQTTTSSAETVRESTDISADGATDVADEGDGQSTSTITLTMTESQAKKVREQEDMVVEEDSSSTYTLSFTTKDIRERRPRLINYIKKTNLTSIIHEKLCRESCHLTSLMKDTTFLTAKLKESMHQKSTLLEAIQQEKVTRHEVQAPSKNMTRSLARQRKRLQRELRRLKKSRSAISDRFQQHRILTAEISKLMALSHVKSEPVIVLHKPDSSVAKAVKKLPALNTEPLTLPNTAGQQNVAGVLPNISLSMPAVSLLPSMPAPQQTLPSALGTQAAVSLAPSKMIQIPVSMPGVPGKSTMLNIDSNLLHLSQTVTGKSGQQQPMLLVQFAPQASRLSSNVAQTPTVAQSVVQVPNRLPGTSQMLHIRLPKPPTSSVGGGLLVQPSSALQSVSSGASTVPLSAQSSTTQQLLPVQLLPAPVSNTPVLQQPSSLTPILPLLTQGQQTSKLGQGVNTVLQTASVRQVTQPLIQPTNMPRFQHVSKTRVTKQQKSVKKSKPSEAASFNPVLLPNGQLLLQKIPATDLASSTPQQTLAAKQGDPGQQVLSVIKTETEQVGLATVEADNLISDTGQTQLLPPSHVQFKDDAAAMPDFEVGVKAGDSTVDVVEYIADVERSEGLTQTELLYSTVHEGTSGQTEEDLLHAAMVQCQLNKTPNPSHQVKDPTSPVHTEVVQTPFSLPSTFSALMDEGCQGFIEVGENRGSEVFSQETNSQSQDTASDEVYHEFDFDV